VRFLLEAQDVAGRWTDFEVDGRFESDAWVTAYVGAALRRAQCVCERDLAPGLAAAAAYLRRTADGRDGWGYTGVAPVDADSTSWAIVMLAGMGNVPPAAYDTLRLHRHGDGGFSTYVEFSDESMWRHSQADVSAIALKALLTEVPREPAAIEACVRYLTSTQEDSGAWPSFWYGTPLYATLHALDALAAQDPRLHGCDVDRAVRYARSTVDTTDPFELAFAAEIEHRWGSATVAEELAQAILTLQRPDGRWTAEAPVMRPDPWKFAPNDPDAAIFDQWGRYTTATVLRSLAALEATPE
jgi:hypothetical protein